MASVPMLGLSGRSLTILGCCALIVGGSAIALGGTVLLMQDPEAQKLLGEIVRNPKNRQMAARLGRELLEAALRDVGGSRQSLGAPQP